MKRLGFAANTPRCAGDATIGDDAGLMDRWEAHHHPTVKWAASATCGKMIDAVRNKNAEDY